MKSNKQIHSKKTHRNSSQKKQNSKHHHVKSRSISKKKTTGKLKPKFIQLKSALTVRPTNTTPLLEGASHIVQETEPRHTKLHRQATITQHGSMDALSVMDQMHIAKLSPGATNSPYAASGNQIPVSGMNFQIARTESTAWDNSSQTYKKLGDGFSYLLMAYMPTASATTNISTSVVNGLRLSGFHMRQFNNPAQDGFTGLDMFGISRGSYSMSAFYGSDASSFSNGGYVWAGEIKTVFAIPQATIAGVIYEGVIQANQLLSVGTTGVISNVISAEQLMRIASSVRKMEPDEEVSVIQKVGVVNHNLLWDAPEGMQNNFLTDHINKWGAELIHWVVVQTPSVPIAGGSTIYTLAQSVSGNYVFFPRYQDPFTNSLFRNFSYDLNNGVRDYFTKGLATIAHHPSARMAPALNNAIQEVQNHVLPSGDLPVAKQDSILDKVWRGTKAVGEWVWDHKELLASIASHFIKEEGEEYVYNADIRQQCRDQIFSINRGIHYGHSAETAKVLIEELEKLCSWLVYQPEWVPVGSLNEKLSVTSLLPRPLTSLKEDLPCVLQTMEMKESPKTYLEEFPFEQNFEARILEPEEWGLLELDSDKSFVAPDVFKAGEIYCRVPKPLLKGGGGVKHTLRVGRSYFSQEPQYNSLVVAPGPESVPSRLWNLNDYKIVLDNLIGHKVEPPPLDHHLLLHGLMKSFGHRKSENSYSDLLDRQYPACLLSKTPEERLLSMRTSHPKGWSIEGPYCEIRTHNWSDFVQQLLPKFLDYNLIVTDEYFIAWKSCFREDSKVHWDTHYAEDLLKGLKWWEYGAYHTTEAFRNQKALPQHSHNAQKLLFSRDVFWVLKDGQRVKPFSKRSLSLKLSSTRLDLQALADEKKEEWEEGWITGKGYKMQDQIRPGQVSGILSDPPGLVDPELDVLV